MPRVAGPETLHRVRDSIYAPGRAGGVSGKNGERMTGQWLSGAEGEATGADEEHKL